MAINRFHELLAILRRDLRRDLRIFLLTSVCGLPAICYSQQPGGETSTRSGAAEAATAVSHLRAAGLKALQAGDTESAVEAADAMVRLDADDPRTTRAAADLYLRGGEPDRAVRMFDRYLESRPDDMPYLWQRGIALFFAKQYKRGIEQFENHRKVNPNDVENAAWHFLCVAKAYSPEEAKKRVLEAPNDSRVPMEEIHRMLTTGDSAAVTEKIDQTANDAQAKESAEFYGNLYLGLYADAIGEPKKARGLVRRAAKDAPHNYMGDVARVYADWLQQESE